MDHHYHVGQNVPGYLPESDVDYAATKTEAIALLRERKAQWLDAGWDLNDEVVERGRNQYRFTGNARDLFYAIEDRTGGPHHLGYVMWANECNEEDCYEEGAQW